jgi:tripartite-type tricarboxylate transporter receptor subunit TctC
MAKILAKRTDIRPTTIISILLELVTDLLGGRGNMIFNFYSVYENHIRNGKLKAQGVKAPTRMG